MAVGQGGYYTNNLTIATAAQLSQNELVAVDTQYSNGSAPQTLAVPLGLISQNWNIDTGATAITAHAGGGQSAAFQLGYGISNVTVVATAADSVKLPPAYPGKWCFVMNSDASDSMQVFGYGVDTVNGVATGTGVAQAAGKAALYVCLTGTGSATSAGTWVRLLGA